MPLLLLTVGVAAEQYGHGFLNTLGYIDVAGATIALVIIVLGSIARGVAVANDPHVRG